MKYKLTRVDTGATWLFKTYSEASLKATTLRNIIIKATNGYLKPRFRIETL